MIDTNDYASRVHEEQRKREQARTDALCKQDARQSDEARKVLGIECIQKPEPIA